MRAIVASMKLGRPVESAEEIRDTCPDLHADPIPAPNGQVRYVKTHLIASYLHPCWERTRGAIVVVRDPLETLASNVDYLSNVYRADGNTFLNFVKYMGVPEWDRMGMGTWPVNVGSWVAEASRIPIAFVRYCSLKLSATSAACAARRAISMLDDSTNGSTIAVATRTLTRDYMRRLADADADMAVFGRPGAQCGSTRFVSNYDRQKQRLGWHGHASQHPNYARLKSLGELFYM